MKKLLIIKPARASSPHCQYLCVDCCKQVAIKDFSCNECGGLNVGYTSYAYRVARRGNKKEWKYIRELINLFSTESRLEEIPYLGFYKDRNSPPKYNEIRYATSVIVNDYDADGKLIGGHRKTIWRTADNYNITKLLQGNLKLAFCKDSNTRMVKSRIK